MEKEERTALYEIHHEGRLMYVGISKQPRSRATAHGVCRTAPAGSVLTVIQWYDTKREAHAAERRMIAEKQPPMNMAGGPKNFVSRADRALKVEDGDNPEFFAALDDWLNEHRQK